MPFISLLAGDDGFLRSTLSETFIMRDGSSSFFCLRLIPLNIIFVF